MEPFQFRRTGDADYPKYIKALILGSPKSGKTSMIATFPNVVVADVEAGLMSIAHLDVPYVTIDSTNKLSTLQMVLAEESMRKKAAENLGLEKIETVAVDTLDSLQEMMKKERLKSERRTTFERADWGWLLDSMRDLLRGLIALPMHVVLTVHTKTIQDEDSHIITMPGLQGAIAEEIAGMVGFSILMNRKQEVNPQTGQPFTSYSLKVEGDERNPHLGNRAAGRLPSVIEPKFEVLHKAIYEGLDLRPARDVAAMDSTPPAQPQVAPAAQQQEQAAGVAYDKDAAPTGKPKSDEDNPVTEVALQHLTKMLGEFDFALPTTAKGWTLGFARTIGQMIVAHKQDVALGQLTKDEAKAKLQEFLEEVGAYQDPDQVVPEGTISEVMSWVGTDKERAKLALEHEKSGKGKGRRTLCEALEAKIGTFVPQEPVADLSQPEPEQEEAEQAEQQPEQPEQPEPEPVSDAPASEQTPVQSEEPAEPTEEQALATVKETLGAQEVTPTEMDKATLMRLSDIAMAPPCEATGNPIDDLDIAKLSLTRYGKWLSVEAYLEHMRSLKSA